MAACSEEVRKAAAALDTEGRRERFARGLLAWPHDWLPPPLTSENVEVKWLHRPADGLLRGLVFSDGSSYMSGWPGCARAGWALVQTDAFGTVQAAAHGA